MESTKICKESCSIERLSHDTLLSPKVSVSLNYLLYLRYEKSNIRSPKWQHSCWSNGKTQVESATPPLTGRNAPRYPTNDNAYLPSSVSLTHEQTRYTIFPG